MEPPQHRRRQGVPAALPRRGPRHPAAGRPPPMPSPRPAEAVQVRVPREPHAAVRCGHARGVMPAVEPKDRRWVLPAQTGGRLLALAPSAGSGAAKLVLRWAVGMRVLQAALPASPRNCPQACSACTGSPRRCCAWPRCSGAPSEAALGSRAARGGQTARMRSTRLQWMPASSRGSWECWGLRGMAWL